MGKTLVFSMYKTRNTAPIMVKVPLTNTAFRLMRDAGSSRGIIFETPENDSYANKVLKHALSAMNVADKIHFHTARHTFATHYLRKNKGDIVTLKTLMGHSKIEQTMVYLTVDEDWLHEGMANFGEWI
jgi:integrase